MTSLRLAALVMMAAFVASRLTGLARNVAVSYQFGTGRELDAYIAANRIPDLLFQIVAGGAVASAFIPVFTGYIVRDDLSGAWQFVSILFNATLVVMAPLILLLGVFAPQVVGLLAPDFEPEYQALAVSMTRVMLPAPLLFTLGVFTTSVLQSRQQFLLPALAPSTYNLGIIAGALVFAPYLGIHGLAVGALAGSMLYLFVQVPGLLANRMAYAPRLDVRHTGLRSLVRLVLPRVLGLAVAQVNVVVALVLASGMAGAIAALDYGWQLMMLPAGVFAMAISSAVFPTLADQTARDQVEAMRRTVAATLRLILFLTIPSSVALVVLARPVVRLLWERGEFGPASTDLTVTAVHFYAVGLVGIASLEIVTRAFYAMQDTRTPVAIALAAMLVNVALALALRPALGHGGLALATALASLLEAGLLALVASRRLGELDWGEVAGSVARSVAAAAAMLAVLLLARAPAEALARPDTLLARAAVVIALVGLGGATYLALAAALRSPELARLLPDARARRHA